MHPYLVIMYTYTVWTHNIFALPPVWACGRTVPRKKAPVQKTAIQIIQPLVVSIERNGLSRYVYVNKLGKNK